MHKNIILVLLLTIGFLSCQDSKEKIDKLEIAKQYYKVLDNSDTLQIVSLISDSIVIRETEHDYEETFSKKNYIDWLHWDSVFDPTYEILQIDQEKEIVKATISKIDQRILFLHKEPIVSEEVIRFDKDKIISVEKSYVLFNEMKFLKNRDELLSWIDKNHPELKGFLHDQTETGGLQYLKAIALFNQSN